MNTDDKFDFTDEEPTVRIVLPIITVDDLRIAYELDRTMNPCERPTKNIRKTS